jgi:hypothetical protein
LGNVIRVSIWIAAGSLVTSDGLALPPCHRRRASSYAFVGIVTTFLLWGSPLRLGWGLCFGNGGGLYGRGRILWRVGS